MILYYVASTKHRIFMLTHGIHTYTEHNPWKEILLVTREALPRLIAMWREQNANHEPAIMVVRVRKSKLKLITDNVYTTTHSILRADIRGELVVSCDGSIFG